MTKVVKFVQNNCTPCKMLDQTLTAMGKSADVIYLITDENRQEAQEKYGVMSTPTMIAFDGDKEVSRVSGVGFGKLQNFFNEC
jgi:thiol-disulfide isomerase/thioredoxin